MLSVIMVLSLISAATAISCELANQKCTYRTGCSIALQEYVRSCTEMIHGNIPPHRCPEECKNALIALTSTDEGKDLMTCECTEAYCKDAKQRVEVCRPHVEKAANKDTILSCDAAQLICLSDATCSKALEYYHKYCQSMFKGRKCSFRCKNSIAILKKQEKSSKLDSCRCTGREEYDCIRIRMNMARLCFNQTIEITQIIDTESNDIKPDISIINDNVNEINDFSNNIDGGGNSSFLKCSWLHILVAFLVSSRYLFF